MAQENVTLDDAAKALFQQLGGPTHKLGDEPADAADDNEFWDKWRIRAIELVHLLTSAVLDNRFAGKGENLLDAINQFMGKLLEMSEAPGQPGRLIIRYRGMPLGKDLTQKGDYVLSIGELEMDTSSAEHMIRRLGIRWSHYAGRLNRAFATLAELRINTLFIRIPGSAPAEQETMRLCLRLLAGYFPAMTRRQPIVIEQKGNPVAVSIITDHRNQPDPNLTLLAALSHLSAEVMAGIVAKVGAALRKAGADDEDEDTGNVYNTLLRLPNLKEKLRRPPIELNNVQWQAISEEEMVVTREQALLGNLVVEKFAGDPQEAIGMLASVYGHDYARVDARDLGDRLQRASRVLDEVQHMPECEPVEKELLDNIESRLDEVQEEVFDDLDLDGEILQMPFAQADGGRKIHRKLGRIFKFFKNRSVATRKMRDLAHYSIDFSDQDYESIAQTHDISREAAEDLVSLLKSCFDTSGRFQRHAFEQNISKFAVYEVRVFKFLWHYLNQTDHRGDRIAFLNALQLLIDRLKKPEDAAQILLEDFSGSPDSVSFSDRNALMLSSLLIRKYNKELYFDIEITPEEVLLVKDGLKQAVAAALVRWVDARHRKFFRKIKAVHRALAESLNPAQADTEPMPSRYLFALEREVYIFLALIGGKTALSIIRGALKQFGDPGARIYQLSDSDAHLPSLLQLLKITVRCLGRIGEGEDIEMLESVIANRERFQALSGNTGHRELVNRIMTWAEQSADSIRQRGEHQQKPSHPES